MLFYSHIKILQQHRNAHDLNVWNGCTYLVSDTGILHPTSRWTSFWIYSSHWLLRRDTADETNPHRKVTTVLWRHIPEHGVFILPSFRSAKLKTASDTQRRYLIRQNKFLLLILFRKKIQASLLCILSHELHLLLCLSSIVNFPSAISQDLGLIMCKVRVSCL